MLVCDPSQAPSWKRKIPNYRAKCLAARLKLRSSSLVMFSPPCHYLPAQRDIDKLSPRFLRPPHRMRNFSMDPSKRTARVSRDIKTHCCRESRPFRIDYILPTRSSGRLASVAQFQRPITRCLLSASISDLSPVTCKSSEALPTRSFCLRLLGSHSRFVYTELEIYEAGFVPTAQSRMRASLRAIGWRNVHFVHTTANKRFLREIRKYINFVACCRKSVNEIPPSSTTKTTRECIAVISRGRNSPSLAGGLFSRFYYRLILAKRRNGGRQ